MAVIKKVQRFQVSKSRNAALDLIFFMGPSSLNRLIMAKGILPLFGSRVFTH